MNLPQEAQVVSVASQESSILRMDTTSKAGMVLTAQMELGRNEVFTEERQAAFAQMAERAADKVEANFRALLLLDAMIVFLSFGEAVKLPILDVTLDQIPGALEIATAISAVAAYFTVTSFYDKQIYDMIVQQFDIKRLQYSGIDPDIITSSRIFKYLHLNFARNQMNNWGLDFFVPGRGAQRFFVLQQISTLFIIIVALPVCHIAATATGLTISAQSLGWIFYPYLVLILITNGFAVALAVGHALKWKYTLAPWAPELTVNHMYSPVHGPQLPQEPSEPSG